MSATRPHAWDDVIDDEIRAIQGGIARRAGLGTRPALLCIDNYKAAFGDRREPVAEMIRRFPYGCGFAAWDAIAPTRRLMEAARAAGIPVIHTTRDPTPQPEALRIWGVKWTSDFRYGFADRSDGDWFAELAPAEGELKVYKRCTSCFFGTLLDAHLRRAGVDTLLVCGNSTSGCVRATVVDAFSLGLRVGVVEECVFDRNWLSHKVNLCDMDWKYADVLFLDEALAYLGQGRQP